MIHLALHPGCGTVDPAVKEVRMSGPRKRPRDSAERRAREAAERREREEAERRERRESMGMALRVVMIVWDIVWTLAREHVFRGAGPGRLL